MCLFKNHAFPVGFRVFNIAVFCFQVSMRSISGVGGVCLPAKGTKFQFGKGLGDCIPSESGATYCKNIADVQDCPGVSNKGKQRLLIPCHSFPELQQPVISDH